MAVEVAHTLLLELDGAFSPSAGYQVGHFAGIILTLSSHVGSQTTGNSIDKELARFNLAGMCVSFQDGGIFLVENQHTHMNKEYWTTARLLSSWGFQTGDAPIKPPLLLRGS